MCLFLLHIVAFMDKNLLKYWKNCLKDAEWSNSTFYQEPRIILRIGHRMPEFLRNKDRALLFPGEETSAYKYTVRIAPCVLLPTYENGCAIGRTFPEYPFFITYTLWPDGRLSMPENKFDRIPIFVRKYLSPNAKDDRTIASLEQVDSLLRDFQTELKDEKEYWQACQTLFRKATGMTFAQLNYSEQPEIVIMKAPVTGISQNILRLYDKLLDCQTDLPLLECLMRCKCEPLLPAPTHQEIYANQQHLAQMSSDFPLSVSQREALGMYTHPQCGRIFAVNGPPGTGKTTFLQTIIANRLVHAVLKGKEPELIVASSVNNQAITNILKDFVILSASQESTEVCLASRWLPELNTLGLYLSGNEKLSDRYAMMLNNKGSGFPKEYDNPERVEEYTNYYLQQFNRYFCTSYKDLTECQKYLRSQMAGLKYSIEAAIQAAERKESAPVDAKKPLWAKLLQPFRKSPLEYDEVLNLWMQNHDFQKHYSRLTESEEYSNLPYVEDMSVRLDISYRYQMFWYAVHYREAEFVRRLSCCNVEIDDTGCTSYTSRLRRLACLFPVFISTFHSLPRYMTCTAESEQSVPLYNTIDLLIVDESGQVSPELAVPSFSLAKQAILVGDVEQIEPIWSIPDQYSFLNLKHFGVVSSEGDSLYAFLSRHGFLSSSGSIMKMARKSCRFQVDGERGAFLREHRRCLNSIIAYCNDYVYHGRLLFMKGDCPKYAALPAKGYVHVNGSSSRGKTGSRFNAAEAEAIVFWLTREKENLERAYKKPVSAVAAIVTPFKAQVSRLRYLFSKLPPHEAESFAEITVGTVHALQGAQYPLVIFSPVNSPGDTAFFMEAGGKYNMLNVAVSRAQYHFLVFGNMHIFHADRDTPSGNLAKWLFDSPDNELVSEFVYQADGVLGQDAQIERLSTLEAHTKILCEALQTARRRVVIVSPFIFLPAMKYDSLPQLIRQAVERGVEVVVYTDHYLGKQNGIWREDTLKGRLELVRNHATVRIMRGIHNKSLAVDDCLLVEGSFNWLSANRNRTESRHECSFLVKSPVAAGHIGNLMEELERIGEESVFYCPPGYNIFSRNFFCLPLYNTCTEEVLQQIRIKAVGLCVQGATSSEVLQSIRNKYPRHGAFWTEQEMMIVWELMNYTNDLDIFIRCLQRSDRSIRYKIEGVTSLPVSAV